MIVQGAENKKKNGKPRLNRNLYHRDDLEREVRKTVLSKDNG